MRDILIVLALALLLVTCEYRRATGDASPARLHVPETSAATGEWRRADRDGMPLLLFSEGERPLAAIGCDLGRRRLLVERMTVRPAGGITTMTVTADNRVRTLPVLWDGASLPIAIAELELDDRMVRSLGRATGSIEIELGGEPRLVLPADRKVEALVEACRS